MGRYVSPVSFGVLLAALAIATVVGVGLSVVLRRLDLIPLVIGAALAIGIAYIVVFGVTVPELEFPSTAPPAPGAPAGTAAPEAPLSGTAISYSLPASVGPAPADPRDLEPSYDPVEEADRLDTEKRSGAPPPSGGDDAQ